MKAVKAAKRQRYHRSFDDNVVKGSPYLKEFVKAVPQNDKQFRCLPCEQRYGKDPLLFENLSTHLASQSHRRIVPSDQQSQLVEAIKYTQTSIRNPAKEGMLFDEDGKLDSEEDDNEGKHKNVLKNYRVLGYRDAEVDPKA